MNKNFKYLVIIPAREGSKGIIKKNLKEFNGVPLIAKTIIETKKINRDIEMYVSSDGKEIIKTAKKYGAQGILRSKKNSGDFSSSEDAITEVINNIDNIDSYNTILFLQCTSPLRNYTDIEKAMDLYENSNSQSLFSGYKDFKPIWKNLRNKFIPINHNKIKRSARQSVKNQITENGAIYIFDIKSFLRDKTRFCGETSAYVMPKSRSIDIDSELDWFLAEQTELYEELL
ncbi:acylneuraminate cytidylyltransferase family protein [SAR86 cluster bacterium]|nr:acylneuraminate cytidylyltransferase family protein [SAR86 cluster bacterium]